jgi:hypothetical protein
MSASLEYLPLTHILGLCDCEIIHHLALIWLDDNLVRFRGMVFTDDQKITFFHQ